MNSCVSMLCLLGVVSLASGKFIHSFAGPYITYLTRMVDQEGLTATCERHFLRVSHFNPQKPYEVQRISGNVTVRMALDDSMWGSLIVDIRANNQWKENYFVINTTKGICSATLRHFPGYSAKVFKMNVIPIPTPCVVKTGTYVVDKEPVDWKFPKYPVLPYGFYRLRFSSGNRLLASKWMMEGHIVPQP